MRTLILPDIHLRWEKAERIIAHVKPDRTVFLGDIFDDFGDTPEMVADTADWFHHSVNNKDRIHIAGNHDVHYWFKDNESQRCSGYQQWKSISINDFVKPQDWEKLVFFYNLDDKWLLTHAGLHPSWVDPANFNSTEIISCSLKKAISKLTSDSFNAKKQFYRNGMHWFAMPGFSRSNSPYYGGILWCDWNEEFHSMRGLHQIVGHTPCREPFWLFVKEGDTQQTSAPIDKVCPELSDQSSYNVCLDSQPGSRYYAVYEDGKLSIHNADNEIK